MRTPTALAALLCAGLATGPALASSTTIIDFTIEVTDIQFDGERDTLFEGKAVGDTFAGFLEIASTPVNVSLTTSRGVFELLTLRIDAFDVSFFEEPKIELVRLFGSGSIFSGMRSGAKLTELVMTSTSGFESLGLDVDDFTPTDVLTLLTENKNNFFRASDIRKEEFKSLTAVVFDISSASIRPDTTPIPLPAAGWLMVAGLGGLAALRRR